jgi:hypothetical protein
VVRRNSLHGRRVFEPLDHAEEWVSSQPSLIPYLTPTLEMIAALRRDRMRRSRPSRS